MNQMALLTYYPEMKETRPQAQIEASLGHYGKHWFLKTPLVLKGRGIVHLGTLNESELTPAAKHKAGWHSYKVTDTAFDQIKAMHDVATQVLL